VIVFDLKCGTGHVFEAWFGSSTAFEEQRAGGLVACPMCGDSDVTKAVMAPNVGTKGNSKAVPPATTDVTPAAMKAAMAALAQAQAKMLEGSQWVGGTFATRARAMHAGEEDHAPIHGQASVAQAKELIDEGVSIAPLPMPVIPPEARN